LYPRTLQCSALALLQSPAYPVRLPLDHLCRPWSEFYCGASDLIELGLNPPITRAPGGDPKFNGPRLRVKSIASYDVNVG